MYPGSVSGSVSKKSSSHNILMAWWLEAKKTVETENKNYGSHDAPLAQRAGCSLPLEWEHLEEKQLSLVTKTFNLVIYAALCCWKSFTLKYYWWVPSAHQFGFCCVCNLQLCWIENWFDDGCVDEAQMLLTEVYESFIHFWLRDIIFE